MDPFTIKPLDWEAVRGHAAVCGGRVVTVEDHYPEVGRIQFKYLTHFFSGRTWRCCSRQSGTRSQCGGEETGCQRSSEVWPSHGASRDVRHFSNAHCEGLQRYPENVNKEYVDVIHHLRPITIM